MYADRSELHDSHESFISRVETLETRGTRGKDCCVFISLYKNLTHDDSSHNYLFSSPAEADVSNRFSVFFINNFYYFPRWDVNNIVVFRNSHYVTTGKLRYNSLALCSQVTRQSSLGSLLQA